MSIEDTTKRDLLHKALSDIEGMEAAGGRQFTADAELMPANGPWDELVALGFAKPEPTDDELFVRTRLPEGWTKRMLDDPRGGEILDERGVARVSTFYKAAFYDRKADCYLMNVGGHLATHGIYGDEPPARPEHWDVLTADERDQYRRSIDRYLQDAKDHPEIYGKRLERVRTLKAQASA